MYAIIKIGGKQHKVVTGKKIKIDKISKDISSEIILDKVLAFFDGKDITLGSPTIIGAYIKATILAHNRDKKIIIFKMRRRKHYKRQYGHRQNYTMLYINEINVKNLLK